MAYTPPMERPLRKFCRKPLRSIAEWRVTSDEWLAAGDPHVDGGTNHSPLATRHSSLLDEDELAVLTVGVHLDLGDIELGLVDLALFVEGDRAEGRVVLARQHLLIELDPQVVYVHVTD